MTTPSEGHYSVVRIPDHWFIACRSDEVKDRPIARTVLGTPLALFRSASGPAALVDRCPHRNVPLSLGRVRDRELECAYHGWRFDGSGACVAVPGSCEPLDRKAQRASRWAARERDGYVWVHSTPDVDPSTEPYRIPRVDDRSYVVIRRELTVRASLHAALENALDVPHTAFLHGGLFRTRRKETEIEVIVRRAACGIEAEYVGEPRPPGLVARLLAPQGGIVQHVDRFLLPSIAQVEYRLGPSHFLVTTVMTPVTEAETRFYAVLCLRLPVPSALLRLFTPFAMRIFHQDAAILAHQTDNVRRFCGEQYANTSIDVLGQQIWRLLKAAERGEAALPVADLERRLRMRV